MNERKKIYEKNKCKKTKHNKEMNKRKSEIK